MAGPDVHEKLATALRPLFSATGGRIASSHQRRWASATFVGARHRFVLEPIVIDSPDIEELAARIGNHEFHLPGHLVADICLSEPRWLEAGETVLEIEVLTVEVA